MQNIIASMPFEKIAAYLTELPVTQKGNRYVLAVMDYFTKYLNLYTVADQCATTIAKCFFEDYVGQHGVTKGGILTPCVCNTLARCLSLCVCACAHILVPHRSKLNPGKVNIPAS